MLHQYKQRYEANKDQISDFHKQYYDNNKDRLLTKNKQWRDNNPDIMVLYDRNRKVNLKRAIPGWYEEDLIKLLYLKRDELNKLWGIKLEVDHIIPLNPRDNSVCGLHCWHNLQLLDRSLNRSKHANYQTDW